MRLQEAKRQLKNHLLSEVADEVNARREEKQESEEQAVVIKGTMLINPDKPLKD